MSADARHLATATYAGHVVTVCGEAGRVVRDIEDATCAECLELTRNDTPSAEDVAGFVAWMERRGWEDADCPLCEGDAGLCPRATARRLCPRAASG